MLNERLFQPGGSQSRLDELSGTGSSIASDLAGGLGRFGSRTPMEPSEVPVANRGAWRTSVAYSRAWRSRRTQGSRPGLRSAGLEQPLIQHQGTPPECRLARKGVAHLSRCSRGGRDRDGRRTTPGTGTRRSACHAARSSPVATLRRAPVRTRTWRSPRSVASVERL